MLVIGLTGGIGSGKTTATKLFANYGIDIVDADVLSREVVESGSVALGKIAEHFGADLIDSDGKLKRSKLREVIFNNSAEKDWLEKLLHPLIASLMQTKLAACKSAYCILVSPLLLETDQYKLVDRVLVVDISTQSQLERTLKRDQSERGTIEAIIAAQTTREDRLSRADDVLNNEQGTNALSQDIQALHQKYLILSRKNNGAI